jgi:hypothetical protein
MVHHGLPTGGRRDVLDEDISTMEQAFIGTDSVSHYRRLRVGA